MTDALIFGCGYLGRRVAARWLTPATSETAGAAEDGSGGRGQRKVAALTRQNAATLAALGLEPIIGDVLDPASLRNLPRASTVLYAVGLDRSTGKTMREVYLNGLEHVLDTIPPPDRFIYISSTSVYAQTDGDWVTETSVTEPTEEAGRVVLEAEQLLRAKLPSAVVLRFAGIYGPDRLLRKQQALLRSEPMVGDMERWLNLIHVSDGAEAVLAAEAKATPGETYHIADDTPVSRRDFYTLLAQLLPAPPAVFDHRPEPGSPNRRITNRKAREQLGWVPRFPSYREGLPTAVASSAL